MALMEEQVKIFDRIGIDFQKESILKRHPFSNWIKDEHFKEKLEKLADKTEEKVKSYISPKAIIHILPRREPSLNEYAPPELLKSDYLVLGVVTIGEQADKTPKGANLFESLVTDALKNVALIQAERKVVEFIMEIAEREKLNTTRIIPPGSGRTRWGIENQEFIFKNQQAEKNRGPTKPQLCDEAEKIAFLYHRSRARYQAG